MERKVEEEQRGAEKTQECQVGEEEETTAAGLPAEVETPVAFVPQDLPTATIDIKLPSSILQDIELPPVSHDIKSSSESFIDFPAGTVSSPTLSISTVSDLTPTELGEEIEYSEEQTTTRHDKFYFEDGNVEIVCGHTLFRVHPTVISVSSPKFQDILSPPALLRAPTPEGRPRIIISESAEDSGILSWMIYTPGWVSFPFAVNSADRLTDRTAARFPARHEVPEFTVFVSLPGGMGECKNANCRGREYDVAAQKLQHSLTNTPCDRHSKG